MRRRLQELKANARSLRLRKDLLWYLLVQSAATHGGSVGWDRLSSDPRLLASISYSALKRLATGSREARILETLRRAKIRMQSIKAPRLAANFTRIERMGGVTRATKYMLGLSTHDEKYQFIRTFAGIGTKYGRDIWMGICDPSFRFTVAVDARLKRVARALGFQQRGYAATEEFFRAIARDASIDPWELDRLLYEFTDELLAGIEQPPMRGRKCG